MISVLISPCHSECRLLCSFLFPFHPSLATAATTRSSCAPPQSIQAPPPPPAISVSSLSIGAVIGIVIGILAALLLLGVLTVLLVRYQERRRDQEARRKLDEDIEGTRTLLYALLLLNHPSWPCSCTLGPACAFSTFKVLPGKLHPMGCLHSTTHSKFFCCGLVMHLLSPCPTCISCCYGVMLCPGIAHVEPNDSKSCGSLVALLATAAQILTRHFGSLVRFSAEELSAACNDFDEDNVIGEGGYSEVYKGILSNGTPVAIKKLKVQNCSPPLMAWNIQPGCHAVGLGAPCARVCTGKVISRGMLWGLRGPSAALST